MENNAGKSKNDDISGRIEFVHILEMLKTKKRTGWIREGVSQPESISDHSHRVALLALLSEDPNLDINKCISMAVVHDMAEAIVGDITPFDGVSKEEKTRREEDAMTQYARLLSPSSSELSLPAKRMMSLWKEYEDRATPEAKFVKDLDRFELIAQTIEYEKSQGLKTLQPFIDSTLPHIRSKEVQKWSDELMSERASSLGEGPTPTPST